MVRPPKAALGKIRNCKSRRPHLDYDYLDKLSQK